MIPVDSITDTTAGVVKLTGPCSMSSPCPGVSCPEHGQPAPLPVVTVGTYDVRVAGEWVGFVAVVDGRFLGYTFGGQGVVTHADTLDKAVAGIMARWPAVQQAEVHNCVPAECDECAADLALLVAHPDPLAAIAAGS